MNNFAYYNIILQYICFHYKFCRYFTYEEDEDV